MIFEKELPRVTPESKGVSSRRLLKLIRDMDSIGNEVHGWMVERNGAVLAEGWLAPYDPSFPHTCHSLGKSYTCTAVGIACHDGLLDPEDLVVDLFREEIERFGITPSPLYRKMRLKDLMSMGDGMGVMSPSDEYWTENFLKQEIVYEPGTHFLYNTMSSCMLGLAVEKVTGQRLDDYMREKLLRKIGIPDSDLIWLKFADGTCAEPGISATTEANLRLAMFYLNEGRTDEEEIIDAEWIRRATSSQISGDFDENTSGYGWQLWIGNHPYIFRFDGGQGQICISDKKHDMAVAFHQGAHDPKGMADSIALVQAMLEEVSDTPLSEDPEGYAELRAYLAERALPPAESRPVPENAREKMGCYYMDKDGFNFWIEVIPFDQEFYHQFYDYSVCWNTRTLKFELEEDCLKMTVNGRSVYRCWLDGRRQADETEGAPTPGLTKTSSNAYFEDENTLVVTVRNLNSWVVSRTVFRFSGQDLHVEQEKYMLHETLPPAKNSGHGRRIR